MSLLDRALRRVPAAVAAALALGAGVTTATGAASAEPEPEPFRPAIHYTPEQNWMNDPNGLVHHDGTYHLYYQHNPSGNRWGNMSWGHATSPDLATWTEQPLAIPQTFDDDGVAIEDIFSGSVVVDHGNTSGFGTVEDPPLVAVYTSAYTGAHPTLSGIQAQSLAYSTDGGYTWTKYADNPVLDRDSANFRDPKVFWYDDAEEPAGGYWVMAAVEALDRQVLLYRSDDLKDWSQLSTFGPANATGGIWECPDLFELPVDGDPENTRWVMVVNLNPGAVAGGSGGQYFVGDFDGTTFTPERTVEGVEVPDGEVLADFENGWGDWTVRNEPAHAEAGPFGSAPVAGTVPGQQEVTGYVGDSLLNSFVGHDAPTGTAESAPFTIERDWLSMLVGGGNHPHVAGGQLGNEPPAGTLLWDGFEQRAAGQTLADVGWTGTGHLAATSSPSTSGGEYYLGEGRLNTWEGGPHGDDNVGTLTSPPFVLDGDRLSMLVGGGKRAGDAAQTLQVQLLVDGEVVRHLTGPEAGDLRWRSWDVADLRGREAVLRVVDEATGGWGHLTLDHVVVGDEPAVPRSSETTVNLVVDGEVVRTATGNDAEHLDWVSWDVAELRGSQATLRVVDNHRGGWGHILVDQVTATDDPAMPGAERYDWLDWGRDYYATVSFDNAPDDRRYMIGWMNDWAYAQDIPTSPWRSVMTLPREVTLTEADGRVELTQQVVDGVDRLAAPAAATRVRDLDVDDSTVPLDLRRSGDLDAYRLDVTLEVEDAERAGVVVRAGEGFAVDGGTAGAQGTVVAYDARRGRLEVDRTRSGDVGFHPAFAGAWSAPLAASTTADGKVRLRVYVDRSSVEALTADGLRTVTSQVFPDAASTGVSVFAEGGSARIASLTVTPLADSVRVDTGPAAPACVGKPGRPGAVPCRR
ncbi:GH32 C-terminal domain-containing protein [Isoptericola sp. S6320L]|uniref:glycoside hydrolase family 32 protein n=1 Tax=Isoptericola sp. S6320L TaxID=2926411 RepID=UPI001FF141DA|nr:glycoside hydrolase family 32 protein [Isoptericola sp. S6320L]MCK0117622.1 GH32 C-terminal domain-containing protein [Isoptericola sp. S6320L]